MTVDGPPRDYPGVCPACGQRLQTQYWTSNAGEGAADLQEVSCPSGECGYSRSTQIAI